MNTRLLLFMGLFSFAFIFLSSCGAGDPINISDGPVPIQDIESSSDGLTLSFSKSTFTESPDEIRTSIENDTNQKCKYGTYYSIERLHQNQWYRVVYPDEIFLNYPDFHDRGLLLKPVSQEDQTFSLKRLDIDLPPGTYRLVKTLLCPAVDGKEIALARSFQVKED
ncbi:hypothetical protein GWK91_12415 [Virgibacillus sp. MSP4-1]|uniref:immunoglobulin-like domain-containing protein n=1 Tax=Virgibacillus sp. MSP4-1 TaxID=2700081 RepID=UPI00039B0027|nr:immunoglobulin-like domain-containing protein [Virgibacillus sp. MSP4-1]QHS23706.1 hypothetical protein GWK91_12415 [Virgibacillus sp. MSP4-1]